jgi:hypothetical protein
MLKHVGELPHTYSDILVQLLGHAVNCDVQELGTESGTWNVIIPVTSGVTGVVRKELKKKCKPLQENTQQFHHKRQLL